MNEDARAYLYKRDIPQLFESLMTGLMYSRPDNPVMYLRDCLSRVNDHNLAHNINWNSFLPVPSERPSFSRSSEPLPPIQSEKSETEVGGDDGGGDTRGGETVGSGVGGGLNSSVPLPPIGGSSVGKESEREEVEVGGESEKNGARVVFVLGGPGSGKGTQCERIVEKYGLTHLSAGDLLRAEVASGSEKGKQLEEIMKEGKLVPLEVTLGLLETAMQSAGDVPGFLIDGFPREINQGVEFEQRMTTCPIALVLSYECTEDVMTQRLLERGRTSGRADDNKETIKKRFDTFRDSTMPVLEHYREQGKLKTVNADRAIDEVFLSTCEVMEAAGFEASKAAALLVSKEPLPPIGKSGSEDDVETQDKQTVDAIKIVNAALKDSRVVFVLGGPGSGKGTQCERIVERYNLTHLSSGDLLRAEVASGSKTGKQLEETMKEGKLVPLEVTLSLLESAMTKAGNSPGFLIDGFPRTLNQGCVFEKHITACGLVLSYECSEEVMTRRLLERAKTSGRSDDNEETIKKRFHTFKESTIPVLEYYSEQGKLKKIDSDRSISDVFQDTCTALEANGFQPVTTHSLKDSKVVFVLGGPGSGKGTQCERIVERYKVTHFSAGDLLRAEVASGSEKGKELEETMKEGKLVPLEVTLGLIEDAMKRSGDSPGFLIDGFPREINQGLEFERLITPCCVVLSYECSEEVMMQRLLERGKTSGRADDNEETIKKRFHTFKESTMPVLEYYDKEGKLRKIDADQSIDEVFHNTCAVLDVTTFQPVVEHPLKHAKVVFVLGGPGSGKGTQCERIVERYSFTHFSAGDLLRAEVASGSEKGKELEEMMKEGKLVPIEVTLSLLEDAMMNTVASPGFLIDGFPREINQALEFEKKITLCHLVLSYECSEDVMTQRLLERGKTSGRADDNEETIKKRFDTFNESTLPVLDYYGSTEQGKLRKIDANRAVEEVFEETCCVLEDAGFLAQAAKKMKDAKVIFVLGGPGSGKGTQCERIVERYGLSHFSAGDLLRAEVASGSEKGKQLEETMKEGKLVPLEVTLGLIEAAMIKVCESPGFLIDGFPRDVNQGVEFERTIASSHLVLCYECSEEVMMQRLLERGKTSGRSDDNEETIKKRFTTFQDSTIPVLDFYSEKGTLKKIDADREITEVFTETCVILDEAGFTPRSP